MAGRLRAARLIATLLFCIGSASAALVALTPTLALAQRTHTVRAGQSLARIAARYHVSVADLAAANGLGTDASVRIGQELRVPDVGVAYVREGQTLSDIARRAGCSVAELMRLNHIRDAASLRVGQRIILPGHEAHAEREEAASRWGRPRRPGFATLLRVSRDERARVRMLDRRGRATRVAREHLGRLMRPNRAGRRERFPEPDRRLIEVLARISDHFGGRALHIMSGYRPAGGFTREGSRHVGGHAVDLRIPGVPNTELRDYCRTFDDVGVGYYPRSTFVHIDVRDRSAYWVDWSGRGERPRYQRREGVPDDATPSERRRAGAAEESDEAESGGADEVEADAAGGRPIDDDVDTGDQSGED